MLAMETSPLWLYALLVAGVIALPGMDMAFVAASTLSGGRRQGLAALAGIVLGGGVHMVAGLLGLGLLLQASPLMFNAILLAGAGYVAWLGWPLLRHAPALAAHADGTPALAAHADGTPALAAHADGMPALAAHADKAPAQRNGATLLRGLATCLLNPKAYVFSVTVLPAYLTREPSRALALVAITASAQMAIYGAVLFAASRGRRRFVASPWFSRGVGLLLVASAGVALLGLRSPG
jgi:threonine/homoserine/homoserine lactone efflux protein